MGKGNDRVPCPVEQIDRRRDPADRGEIVETIGQEGAGHGGRRVGEAAERAQGHHPIHRMPRRAPARPRRPATSRIGRAGHPAAAAAPARRRRRRPRTGRLRWAVPDCRHSRDRRRRARRSRAASAARPSERRSADCRHCRGRKRGCRANPGRRPIIAIEDKAIRRPGGDRPRRGAAPGRLIGGDRNRPVDALARHSGAARQHQRRGEQWYEADRLSQSFLPL